MPSARLSGFFFFLAICYLLFFRDCGRKSASRLADSASRLSASRADVLKKSAIYRQGCISSFQRQHTAFSHLSDFFTRLFLIFPAFSHGFFSCSGFFTPLLIADSASRNNAQKVGQPSRRKKKSAAIPKKEHTSLNFCGSNFSLLPYYQLQYSTPCCKKYSK